MARRYSGGWGKKCRSYSRMAPLRKYLFVSCLPDSGKQAECEDRQDEEGNPRVQPVPLSKEEEDRQGHSHDRRKDEQEHPQADDGIGFPRRGSREDSLEGGGEEAGAIRLMKGQNVLQVVREHGSIPGVLRVGEPQD